MPIRYWPDEDARQGRRRRSDDCSASGSNSNDIDGGDERRRYARCCHRTFVLDLDAATLTVPADEPEPFPSTDRTLLLSDLDDWLNGVEENRAL